MPLNLVLSINLRGCGKRCMLRVCSSCSLPLHPVIPPALSTINSDWVRLMLDLTVIKNFQRVFAKTLCKSDVLCGALIFLLIDLIFRVSCSWNQDKSFRLGFDIPYRSYIWWATKDFLSQPKGSDVILLGASEMAAAVNGADATYLNTSVATLLNHHCQYLEAKLQQSDSQHKGVFCLAIGGAMPSDSYFTAKTLLSGERKPKAIVCSIAPRSFCDAAFVDPASSDIYKLMSKLSGAHDLELSCHKSIWDRIDRKLQGFCSIYDHKYELTSWQHHLLQAILSKLLDEDFSKVRAPTYISKLALLELSDDHAPSEFVSVPFDPKHATFTNNIAEYQVRYCRLDKGMFYQQLDYLKRLSELCRSEGIQLVVINSPLTTENRQLIKPPFYDAYINETSGVARNCGATFVNLDLPAVFKHDDFSDTIHLNGRGGLKYLDQIALVLSTTSKVVTSNTCHQTEGF